MSYGAGVASVQPTHPPRLNLISSRLSDLRQNLVDLSDRIRVGANCFVGLPAEVSPTTPEPKREPSGILDGILIQISELESVISSLRYEWGRVEVELS